MLVKVPFLTYQISRNTVEETNVYILKSIANFLQNQIYPKLMELRGFYCNNVYRHEHNIFTNILLAPTNASWYKYGINCGITRVCQKQIAHITSLIFSVHAVTCTFANTSTTQA